MAIVNECDSFKDKTQDYKRLDKWYVCHIYIYSIHLLQITVIIFHYAYLTFISVYIESIKRYLKLEDLNILRVDVMKSTIARLEDYLTTIKDLLRYIFLYLRNYHFVMI